MSSDNNDSTVVGKPIGTVTNLFVVAASCCTVIKHLYEQEEHQDAKPFWVQTTFCGDTVTFTFDRRMLSANHKFYLSTTMNAIGYTLDTIDTYPALPNSNMYGLSFKPCVA